MSFRITLILAGILVALGLFVYFFQIKKPPERAQLGPEVWGTEEEQIFSIQIALPRTGQSISFVKAADDSWHFDDAERSPIDPQRWGGIPLLVSGPASKRLIAQRVEDISQYGLDRPQMEITLGIRDWGRLKVLVGDTTPDGGNYYVKLRDWDPLYIVDHTWGEVLERLVTEPPRLPAASSTPATPSR